MARRVVPGDVRGTTAVFSDVLPDLTVFDEPVNLPVDHLGLEKSLCVGQQVLHEWVKLYKILRLHLKGLKALFL